LSFLAALHHQEDNFSETIVGTGRRALVTGAPSGIGVAIARELAAPGIDLVLTARRRDALDAVASTRKGVEVEIITADLGDPDAARALWEAAIASGPIDVLINNAGFGYFHRFDEVDWARDAELIQLDLASLALLSRCFVDPPSKHRTRAPGGDRIDRRVPVSIQHGAVRCVQGLCAQLQRGPP
jgi:NAD(P)-dependent dehydrogenase (short-subunit alcohol dehydrogenase family)